jgi:hypothetical protein
VRCGTASGSWPNVSARIVPRSIARRLRRACRLKDWKADWKASLHVSLYTRPTIWALCLKQHLLCSWVLIVTADFY